MNERFEVAGPQEALGLEGSSGLVSIVGGGGKSSLMFALAGALPGRVVMTTTTRIFASQMELADEVLTLADQDWEARLDATSSNVLVVGRVDGDRAVGVSPELPAKWLALASVDWVVVEADGSRMLPVKAPADHEPVVPPETDLLVAVAGIDALERPIAQVAHRPARVAAIAGLTPEDPLTPEALARVLAAPEGGLKNIPAGSRAALLLNKVETSAQREAARRVAQSALELPRVDRVAIGALRAGSAQRWEVHRRGDSARAV
jgi:molybdenum cofactor cytidylyltransferase